MTPVIEVKGVTKRFPGVIANDNVDFHLYEGEVLGLLGENGAGKSTLMNIIYGLYAPDEGQIAVKGEPVTFQDPSDAIDAGIGMVHQHFMLVPVMTVTENIMLGVEETTNSAVIATMAAAVLGIGAAFAAGGWASAFYFALVAAIYGAVTFLFDGDFPLGRMLFGALTGAGFGLLLETIGPAILGLDPTGLWWPLLGIAVGTLANLRWMDKGAVKRRIRSLSEQYKLDVDPDALVRDLPVGAQQRVEIIKALYRDANVLILDEPTAVLTPQEADELFEIMRELTERGVSIIFITHKLREVLAIADRIMVLRRGRVVGETTPNQADRESLAKMMVGREVVLKIDKTPARPGDVILQVDNLTVIDERDQVAVDSLSIAVHAGEIVGIAGVQGNGQTELVEAITGLRVINDGRVFILGQDIQEASQPRFRVEARVGDATPFDSAPAVGWRRASASPRVVTMMGVAHIPEDRQKHGLVLTYPIADNMVLPDYFREPFSRGIVLDEQEIEDNAQQLVQSYDIRTPSIYTTAGKLSGGNQQKVIVARELAREPQLLIASQPTRGLDVGSIEFIHTQIVNARDNGAAVLLVSAELDEVLSLSDRVIVMYRGKAMADMPIEEATRERLGLLMAGVEEHGR